VRRQGAQGRVLASLRAAPTLRLPPWRPPSARSWPSRAMNSGKTVATGPTGFLVPTAPNSRKAGLRI